MLKYRLYYLGREIYALSSENKKIFDLLNVDFALFISIRKIILTANNAINYTHLCRTCVNIHRVSSEK